MTSPNDAEPVDVDEVLPPDAPGPAGEESDSTNSGAKRHFPAVVASLLDEFITIPKTNIRLGLDPIIGFFFPAVGDALGAALGSTILLEALRRDLPRRVLIRMGVNVTINAGIGAIPIVGDLFSVWFKSNSRNYVLLERHSAGRDRPAVKPTMWPLLVFLLAIFGLIAFVISVLVILFRMTFIDTS